MVNIKTYLRKTFGKNPLGSQRKRSNQVKGEKMRLTSDLPTEILISAHNGITSI